MKQLFKPTTVRHEYQGIPVDGGHFCSGHLNAGVSIEEEISVGTLSGSDEFSHLAMVRS